MQRRVGYNKSNILLDSLGHKPVQKLFVFAWKQQTFESNMISTNLLQCFSNDVFRPVAMFVFGVSVGDEGDFGVGVAEVVTRRLHGSHSQVHREVRHWPHSLL